VLLLQVVDVHNKGTLVLDDCNVSCCTVSWVAVVMCTVWEAAGLQDASLCCGTCTPNSIPAKGAVSLRFSMVSGGSHITL
jgi:hypothetical protein